MPVLLLCIFPAGHHQAAANEPARQSPLQAVGVELPAPQPEPVSAAKGQRGRTGKPGAAGHRIASGSQTPAASLAVAPARVRTAAIPGPA